MKQNKIRNKFGEEMIKGLNDLLKKIKKGKKYKSVLRIRGVNRFKR